MVSRLAQLIAFFLCRTWFEFVQAGACRIPFGTCGDHRGAHLVDAFRQGALAKTSQLQLRRTRVQVQLSGDVVVWMFAEVVFE